jgi:non-heme chloroperoxidase
MMDHPKHANMTKDSVRRFVLIIAFLGEPVELAIVKRETFLARKAFSQRSQCEVGILLVHRRGSCVMRLRESRWAYFILPLALGTALQAQKKPDLSKHTVQMVSVERGVRLEVLDWGGTGRPLVLLTGLADDAHIFDEFAPKLTVNFHVYGVTRRGRGISSSPSPDVKNYSAARLGEDVLSVIDALHLDKPVVAGHSIAGEELSYIGSHHPEKVAGLIYIEAGYPYALYDEAHGELELDAIYLRDQLRQFINGYALEPVKDYDSVIANLERVEHEIKELEQKTKDLPPTPISPRMTPELFAVMEGRERFTTIRAPALVIMAGVEGEKPDPVTGDDPQSRAAAARQLLDMQRKELQYPVFARQVPAASVIRISHATHYIFQSNEVDVLREINAFIATLPPAN